MIRFKRKWRRVLGWILFVCLLTGVAVLRFYWARGLQEKAFERAGHGDVAEGSRSPATPGPGKGGLEDVSEPPETLP